MHGIGTVFQEFYELRVLATDATRDESVVICVGILAVFVSSFQSGAHG